jgi:inner membrane transporter RhtA
MNLHAIGMQNPAHIAFAAPSRTVTERIQPHVFFLVSALFHYLGPSFAVLLFARIAPLGVAWLRIASAAVVFGLWRQPWRYALRCRRPSGASCWRSASCSRR